MGVKWSLEFKVQIHSWYHLRMLPKEEEALFTEMRELGGQFAKC